MCSRESACFRGLGMQHRISQFRSNVLDDDPVSVASHVIAISQGRCAQDHLLQVGRAPPCMPRNPRKKTVSSYRAALQCKRLTHPGLSRRCLDSLAISSPEFGARMANSSRDYVTIGAVAFEEMRAQASFGTKNLSVRSTDPCCRILCVLGDNLLRWPLVSEGPLGNPRASGPLTQHNAQSRHAPHFSLCCSSAVQVLSQTRHGSRLQCTALWT